MLHGRGNPIELAWIAGFIFGVLRSFYPLDLLSILQVPSVYNDVAVVDTEGNLESPLTVRVVVKCVVLAPFTFVGI